jgi:hypothetical protein
VIVLLVWSYVFPVLIALVIALNRWTRWPHSWGIGALAQAGQIAAGLLFKPVQGLWLSVLGLGMFVVAWVTALRDRRRDRRAQWK